MPTTKLAAVPAKISAPRLTETYDRKRLFRAMDSARRTKKVIWIVAPAGAGKTSVVTTYLKARRLPTLWYNVDIRDADVAHVFHYLAVAVRLASPRRKLHLPAFAVENQAGVTAFARGFFEALFRQRPAPSAIVIDDYHEARSEHWDEVVREAIGALPDGLCAIIVSRTDPPPLVVREVASGAVALLGTEDFRLTPRETHDLVRLHRPDLRGARLRGALPGIVELANGWAAALTLLLQSRRVVATDTHSVEEFSERLFDYVATEILGKATPEQHDFLLKTSVVPTLTSSLAICLTGYPTAARMLTDLEERSFLTQRLGDSGAYRYHPLLRGFLMRRAEEQLGRSLVQQLHRKAAESLAENGQIDEALEQFNQVEDAAAPIGLLLRVAPSYVAIGRGRTIDLWISRLPSECVQGNGWLLYWQAVCCIGYAPSRPRDLLERAFRVFERQKDVQGLYLTCATAVQAVIYGGNFSPLDRWLERCESLEASGLDCPEPLQPMVATGMMIGSIFHRMSASDHHRWTERALQLATGSEDIGHRIFTGSVLAMYFCYFTSPARAAVIIEMLRASARAAESSVVAQLTLLQAEASYVWVRGDNRACLELVRKGLAIAARTGAFAWNNFLQGLGASAALGLEDLAAAQEFLELLAETAQLQGGWQAGWYHILAGWDAAVRGDPVRALHHAELSCEHAEAEGPPIGRLVAAFATIHALWLCGRRSEAIAALERTRQTAQELASSFVTQGCDLLEADLLWEEDRDRAVSSLRKGLALARELGYHNMYWQRRAAMTRLSVRALEHGIEPDHVRAGILKHRLTPDGPTARLEAWPWRYRLRALGSFELTCENEPSWRSDAPALNDQGRNQLRGVPLRLLEAVVALGGRSVHDVDLIDALWPNAEGDAGRRVFDTTLHRLRRQLGGDDALRLSDGRLGLDEGSCWVDFWALEHMIADVHREIRRGAPVPELVSLSRQLLGLYRGPLLADRKEAWIVRSRQRLAARFRWAVDQLGRVLEQGAHFLDAAALYQRALDSDPHSDALAAGLARCAAGLNRRSDGKHASKRTRHRSGKIETPRSEQG